jgi:hypothetical protein
VREGGRTHPDDSGVAFGLLVASEVPGGDGEGGDDLSTGENELRGPVPAEEEVQEGISLVGAVVHGSVLSRHSSGLNLMDLDISRGGQVERVDHPRHEKQHDGDALEDRHEHDDWHRCQGTGSFFNDSDREEDSLAEDADEAGVEGSDDEADDAESLHRHDLSVGACV